MTSDLTQPTILAGFQVFKRSLGLTKLRASSSDLLMKFGFQGFSAMILSFLLQLRNVFSTTARLRSVYPKPTTLTLNMATVIRTYRLGHRKLR